MKRDRNESLKKQEKEHETHKVIKQSKLFNKEVANNTQSTYDISKETKLDRQFFRKEVVELAQQLLGKVIVKKTQQGIIRAIIVQTEAYKAPLDKACHATKGKTQRTKYFWLDGGHLYLYTIYMPTNICLNVVAGLEGQPQAVLIRAVQPIQGIEIIQDLRKIKSKKIEDFCNGPAKIGMSLGIDKEKLNGIDLTKQDAEIQIVDAGITGFKMGVSKRINIQYAQEWIQKPWRFYIEGNSFVSKADPDKPQKEKPKKK